MKEYPNSEHQLKAHLLGLQSKMRLYQGTLYPGVPLNDAKKIADRTLSQSADKLGKEREPGSPSPSANHRGKRPTATLPRPSTTRNIVITRRATVLSERDQGLPRHGEGKDAKRGWMKIKNEPDEPPSIFNGSQTCWQSQNSKECPASSG